MSLFFYVGCQKEVDNHHSKAEKNKLVAQTVKRNYDLVKSHNKGKIIENFCSDWWYMTISIGNGYSVQTKPEDKLTFPNPIN